MILLNLKKLIELLVNDENLKPFNVVSAAKLPTFQEDKVDFSKSQFDVSP